MQGSSAEAAEALEDMDDGYELFVNSLDDTLDRLEIAAAAARQALKDAPQGQQVGHFSYAAPQQVHGWQACRCAVTHSCGCLLTNAVCPLCVPCMCPTWPSTCSCRPAFGEASLRMLQLAALAAGGAGAVAGAPTGATGFSQQRSADLQRPQDAFPEPVNNCNLPFKHNLRNVQALMVSSLLYCR